MPPCIQLSSDECNARRQPLRHTDVSVPALILMTAVYQCNSSPFRIYTSVRGLIFAFEYKSYSYTV